MNPETGHLQMLRRDEKAPPGYELLPRMLQATALRKLNGKAEAQVNLRSSSPLSQWAKKTRDAKRNAKRKAKIAAQSRRTNRK